MSMSSFKLLVCTLFASAAAFQGSVLSFQLKKKSARPSREELRTRTSTAVGVGYTMEPSNDDIRNIFTRAQDCVYNCEEGRECSMEVASNLLQDLTLLLSECGKTLGTDNAICEDQDVAAELVAKLRMMSSPTASAGAISENKIEASAWAGILWKVLTDLQVPTAVLFYFACVAFILMVDPNAGGVDFHETNAKVNDFYSSGSTLPPAFFNRMF